VTATANRKGPRRRLRRHVQSDAILYLGILCGLIVFLSHGFLIDLPYHWDEIRTYIPATFHLYRHGEWPGTQPPGLMLYLAAAWKLFWPGIWVTRAAMLLVGTFALLAAFLLGIELCAYVEGFPALLGILFLALSPLCFSQAILAQPDVPAMLFTCLGLYWFIRERMIWAAAACLVLVLTRDTGMVLPLVLAAWLGWERRYRHCAFFLAPVLVSLFGIVWFGQGIGMPSISRTGVALVRYLFFLGVEQGHLLALAGIAVAGWTGVFNHRRWKVAGLFVAVFVLVVSAFGGPPAERAMLPVLPVLYMAAAAGFVSVPLRTRAVLAGCFTVLLVMTLFWHPPLWPYPYENNLAMVDFVRLQQQVAIYLEQEHANDVVTTAWPLSAALRQPEFGYVRNGFRTDEELNFSADRFLKRPQGSVPLFVLYSRDWDPSPRMLNSRVGRWLSRHWLGYGDPLTGQELERKLGLQLVRRMGRSQFWAEVYTLPQSATSAPGKD